MTLLEFEKTINPLSALEIRSELRAWDAISLPEMDGVALMDRVDTKYLLDEGCLLTLLQRIQPEYRILEIDGDRVFRYETLDFDTPQRQCYLQHHNGKLNRQKYRIRKYRDSGRCFLEIKARSSKGRTDKRRMAISTADETLPVAATGPREDGFQPPMSNPRPQMILIAIRYSRDPMTLLICTVLNLNRARCDPMAPPPSAAITTSPKSG